MAYASNADLILYVVDSSVPLDESDEQIISLIKEKNAIILLNKTDLDGVVTEELLLEKMKRSIAYENPVENELAETNQVKIIKTSTKDHTGIDLFENTVKEMFLKGDISFNDEVFITNMRHKEAIMDAKNSLLLVKKSLEDHMPEDFYSIDLMSAYASLGTIIGEEVSDDLVNEIFSKFCMGK